jgi:hypothetical protein
MQSMGMTRFLRAAQVVLSAAMCLLSSAQPLSPENRRVHVPARGIPHKLAGSASGTTVTWVVTSTADSGPETLRQHLLDATRGDTITFDSAGYGPGT